MLAELYRIAFKSIILFNLARRWGIPLTDGAMMVDNYLFAANVITERLAHRVWERTDA